MVKVQGCRWDTHLLHLSARFAPFCQVCTVLPGLHPCASKCSCVIVKCGSAQIPPLPGERRRLAADELHGSRPFYTTHPPHPSERVSKRRENRTGFLAG